MLADAGVAEPSLDRIEHAARALGWNGNSSAIRSATWVAKRDGHLRAAGHGHYALREWLPAREPAGLPDGDGRSLSAEVSASSAAREPGADDTTRDALAECVGRLAYVVEELKDAVGGLARK